MSERRTPPRHWKSFAAGSVIALYFLLLTHGGLGTYFTGDDVMNIAFLHGYGKVSIATIAVQALTIFTPEYRPVAGLYYRTLFALFGLNPLPFRIIFFALLALNLVLAAKLFHELSGSHATALVATLLFSFHPALAALYYNDGTIYDVLCTLFVLLALTRYVRIRQQTRFLTTRDFLILVALYGAALGSKEMALTFPGVLLLYELVFHPDLRNVRQRFWPVLVLAIMTGLYSTLKITVPNPMSSNVFGFYTPTYEPAFIGLAYLRYYALLFSWNHLSPARLIAILVLALVAALVLRNRVMLFGILFANLTLLPVCVIAPREGFVWYMPLLGWALYGGSAVAQFGAKLTASIRKQPAERLSHDGAGWVEAILFGVVVISGYTLQVRHARDLGAPFLPQQEALKTMLAAARASSPALPRGSRIMLESDPFPAVAWEPLFLLRLGYRDPTVWVDRAAFLAKDYHPDDLSLYAMRMRWTGSGYQVVTAPQSQEQPVRFVMIPGMVQRGHSIRVQFPAAFADCPVDVAYRMPEDELIRSGVWLSWADLGNDGSGEVLIDRDAERGVVEIDRIRTCHGRWMPAQASFVIIP